MRFLVLLPFAFLAGMLAMWRLTRKIERWRILRLLALQGINHVHDSRADLRRCRYCRPLDSRGPKRIVVPRDELLQAQDCCKDGTPSPDAPGRSPLRASFTWATRHQEGRKR